MKTDNSNSHYTVTGSVVMPPINGGLEQHNVAKPPVVSPDSGSSAATPSQTVDASAEDASLNNCEAKLLAHSITRHGPLFQINASERIIFGLETTAHFFADLLGLKYSPRDGTFIMGNELFPKSKLAALISQWLRKQAGLVGISYPPADPTTLVFDRLKQLCAAELIDESEGLQIYRRTCLERKDGGSVTTEELYRDYWAFCQARAVVCYPERIFYRHIAAVIREHFGICRSHSVRRTKPDGGLALKYGYWNLAFKGGLGA